ncbi:MAG TPA: CDP-diacylglycerol--glycerol-3-phosphate 3-phosphatidyltransferase [Clostridia bacterium]|nr:MAG: CDP-diacylglycerol--glycerol-3-phosphate 3-phosphatidyltransferase [Firmicutes bacterium ADurb.Bin248]HOG00329.1 CDP-diacylglycerol--glycerol-3-phosphate 3-phosphatidyltransferase [Clostridia bacterium]HOS19022.1 CDP-diacylglycerol--glycerol-3-phosphate 3-phosphatidyltransferase [Clostridia bacterium]HPK14996.1 CDP-diacylglycerol--glycerol-3-phosphate 3-phosphatidyltransferase [Clostridia bacterium]
MNTPNKLTILRMVLTPVFVACFYIPVDYRLYIAAVVFLIAYATDILDGQIARKRNLVTDFGKLMDPIADKILSGAAMIMLTGAGMLSPIATLITVAREFIISGVRAVVAGKNIVIAAGPIGKLKTTMQCVGIALILLGNPVFRMWNIPFDQIVIWISVALAVWSCVDYIVKNNRALKENK